MTEGLLIQKQDTGEEEVCLGLYGKQPVEKFLHCTCSCGHSVSYPLNGIPTVDTLMGCGKDNHWAIRFYPEKV